MIKSGTVRRKKLRHLTVPIVGRNYQSRRTILQENETTNTYASQDVNSE